MAPRKKTTTSKATSNGTKAETETKTKTQTRKDEEATNNGENNSRIETSVRSTQKRKDPPTAQRQGSRKSARGAQAAQPSQQQLLKYMLTNEAEELCRPEDETRDLKSRRDKGQGSIVTYSSSILNPFQELVCAVVLSRPISHMLGLRTIRTIFNEPYSFTSARKMQDAGMETIHKSLWDARTQHKAKTADQLGALADMVLDLLSDKGDEQGTELGVVLKRTDVEAALQDVVNKVKGFGPTGKDIFRRRVQWLWESAYPFVDERSSKALADIGLPSEAEALRQFIHRHWEECSTDYVKGKTEQERKRRALVMVLERVTGASLEGKVDRLREAAAAV